MNIRFLENITEKQVFERKASKDSEETFIVIIIKAWINSRKFSLIFKKRFIKK